MAFIVMGLIVVVAFIMCFGLHLVIFLFRLITGLHYDKNKRHRSQRNPFYTNAFHVVVFSDLLRIFECDRLWHKMQTLKISYYFNLMFGFGRYSITFALFQHNLLVIDIKDTFPFVNEKYRFHIRKVLWQ